VPLLTGIPRMTSEVARNFYAFTAFWQARLAARTTAATPGGPNGGGRADRAIFFALGRIRPPVANYELSPNVGDGRNQAAAV
jgi:hypothetical protein